MSMLDDFISLSEFLLGIPFQPPLPPLNDLDQDLANVYMTQLSMYGPQPSFMTTLLSTWEGIQAQKLSPEQQTAAVQSQIMNDANLGPLARLIILAWYTGFHPWFPPPAPPVNPKPDPANYEQTLVWLLAQAHPMGVPLSFGYWQYPPNGAD
jgi:hypothetical protein